jgi:hypothetical protein
MMQNSPGRLLAGVAAALRDVVAPAIDDPAVRADVEEAARTLEGLEGHVAWRAELLAEPLSRVRSLLAEAADRAPAGTLRRRPDRPREGAAEPPTARAWVDALDALAEVQAWLARPATDEPGLRARVAAFAADEVDRERALLRTGMYRAPDAPPTS